MRVDKENKGGGNDGNDSGGQGGGLATSWFWWK